MLIFQDSTSVTPVITSGSQLITILVGLVAGTVGGYINALYAKGKALLTGLDHTIQLVIGAVAGYALYFISTHLGLVLPDVLNLNAAAFTTIVATAVGKLIATITGTSTPVASTTGVK